MFRTDSGAANSDPVDLYAETDRVDGRRYVTFDGGGTVG